MIYMAENKTLSSLEVNIPIHLKHITYKLGGTEYSKYNQVGKKRQDFMSFNAPQEQIRFFCQCSSAVRQILVFVTHERIGVCFNPDHPAAQTNNAHGPVLECIVLKQDGLLCVLVLRGVADSLKPSNHLAFDDPLNTADIRVHSRTTHIGVFQIPSVEMIIVLFVLHWFTL